MYILSGSSILFKSAGSRGSRPRSRRKLSSSSKKNGLPSARAISFSTNTTGSPPLRAGYNCPSLARMACSVSALFNSLNSILVKFGKALSRCAIGRASC